MAGMSEGILEEPTEEDIGIHIFNQDLDEHNKNDQIDWNHDDYEG